MCVPEGIPITIDRDCLATVHGMHVLRACVLILAQVRRHQRTRWFAPATIARRLYRGIERLDSLSAQRYVHVRTMLQPGGRSHSTHAKFISRESLQQSVGGGALQAMQNVIYSMLSSRRDEIDSTVRGQRSNNCAEDSASKQ